MAGVGATAREQAVRARARARARASVQPRVGGRSRGSDSAAHAPVLDQLEHVERAQVRIATERA